MKAPANTTEQVNRNPMGMLAAAFARGSSGAIEAQEAAGQRDFVGSDTLPTQMNASDRNALEMAGVKFLGPVEGDPLFQYVELPKGWAKKPTDHSMWSDLVDDKSRKRAAIFYKAAFYDRNAHLRLCTRYSYSFNYDRADKESVAVSNVMDGDTCIHATSEIQFDEQSRFEATDKVNDQAREWLEKNYSDWSNPGAYWD